MKQHNENETRFADYQLSRLIDQARLGQLPAQNELFHELRNYLLAVANEQLGDRLQAKLGPSDIVQQSLVRAVENIGDYRGVNTAEFKGWLRQIVINETRLAHRGFAAGKRDAGREQPISGGGASHGELQPVDSQHTPATSFLATEKAELIKRLIEQLPDTYQQVVRWRNWEDLTFDEIGQRLGMSTSGVAKIWYRALVEIQKLYESGENKTDC